MAEEACSSSTSSLQAVDTLDSSRNDSLNISLNLKTSSDYKELDVIGTGAYGTVYKARDLKNPDVHVALKKVKIALTEDGIPLSTLREITLLKQLENLRHPNVVRLLDVCHGQQVDSGKHLILFLVFEHCEQDLASYIDKARPDGIPKENILRMSKEILGGIDFLHSHRIIHRDLKPQNLLVTSTGTIKLADFGLAKTYDPEMMLTSVVVTLWYRPPEVLLGQAYHSGVDVWSAGVVLFEMFSLAPLFPGQSERDQLDKIFKVIGRPDKSIWPDKSILPNNFPAYPPKDLSEICPRIDPAAKLLIRNMLCLDPVARPTAMQCLNDPYFINQDVVPAH